MSLYPVGGAGEEKKKQHGVELVARRELRVSGVEEVIGFDEELVRLESSEGELYVEGGEMKIESLDTESGELTLKGRIDSLYYVSEGQKKRKRGAFGRR